MTPEIKQEILDAIENNAGEIRALRTDVQPMIDIFNTLKRIGKWTAVAVAFLGSLTALALGVKALFKR